MRQFMGFQHYRRIRTKLAALFHELKDVPVGLNQQVEALEQSCLAEDISDFKASIDQLRRLLTQALFADEYLEKHRSLFHALQYLTYVLPANATLALSGHYRSCVDYSQVAACGLPVVSVFPDNRYYHATTGALIHWEELRYFHEAIYAQLFSQSIHRYEIAAMSNFIARERQRQTVEQAGTVPGLLQRPMVRASLLLLFLSWRLHTQYQLCLHPTPYLDNASFVSQLLFRLFGFGWICLLLPTWTTLEQASCDCIAGFVTDLPLTLANVFLVYLMMCAFPIVTSQLQQGLMSIKGMVITPPTPGHETEHAISDILLPIVCQDEAIRTKVSYALQVDNTCRAMPRKLS